MLRFIPLIVVMLSVPSGLALSADPPVGPITGVVVKANENVVLVRPRGADGQLGKAVALKVRGTSKVFALSTQKREGQIVPVQREIAPKDLQPEQTVTAIYTIVNDDTVLLVAVAHPAASK